MISKLISNKLRMSFPFILSLFFFNSNFIFSQGYNHTWLLGYHYQASSILERMNFSISSYALVPEQRPMDFADTEGNISDSNGNFLMSSNGVWIADSSGNIMQNGDSLNPGWAVNSNPDGLPQPYSNLFIPFPGDSNKYILFHQAADLSINLLCPAIYYSIIDISLNGGLGAVISKNNIALSGNFSWGFAACKHGNGRDWWVTAMSDVATGIHTFLVTPDTVQYMGLQNFPIQSFMWGFAGQPTFSPDGTKFAFGGSYNSVGMAYQSCGSLFDFDRCSGVFSVDTVFNLPDTTLSLATAFSPNSQYLYFATINNIYQINTDTLNLPASFQTVAVNDTFMSTGLTHTDFWLMYLAANGKIYLTSGSSVLHLHEMDYPDSAGVACNVNLHNIVLNCLNLGTVPNHPNYYLGRLFGSPCDSLTSTTEIEHNFHFNIYPNPNNGNFSISYLLPQNKNGKLEITDVNCKTVFKYNLPQWSTLQNFSLPKIANGIYNCSITSNGERVNKKLIVFDE